jgi:hypothetical protein
VAGISAFVTSYRCESLISPLPTFLLQQVESAQVSSTITGRGTELPANHVNKLIRALHDRKHQVKDRVTSSKSRRATQSGLLFDLAARVPQLLEAFDASSNGSDYALLDSLRTLEQELTAWLTCAAVNDRRVANSPCDAESSIPEDGFQPDPPRNPLCLLTRESLCRICLLLVSECVAGLQSHESSALHSALPTEMCAAQLRSTTQLLACAAKVPICTARAVSAPLHFLKRYYMRIGDTAGREWCAEFKNDILQSAPWLRWDVLLPWSLLTVHDVPLYRA